MDLKAIEERNQMCLDQAIDEGWDEGDIARILFDEDVPALIARVKELEDAMGLVLGWLERENPNAIAAVTLRRALNPTVSDTPSGRG